MSDILFTSSLQKHNPTFEIKTTDGTKKYEIKNEDPGTILSVIAQKYIADLKEEKKGWQDLVKQDQYSAREWLMAGTNITQVAHLRQAFWPDILTSYLGICPCHGWSILRLLVGKYTFRTTYGQGSQRDIGKQLTAA